MIPTVCPAPTTHTGHCHDTRYDNRGDCHGHTHTYTLTDYILDGRPGEQMQMCGSHGRQASRKGEVKRV
ncbi:hypothetical protein [Micromonospora sp. NBC_00421]|uniref:hypothetical protein n=1 Tax=Micromonospora sp. NBC_00421 TaxID=2975976 RepID=UPI002E2162D4